MRKAGHHPMQVDREGTGAMTDVVHKFRIGQIVDLIPATFRSAAKGAYEVVQLVPVGATDPQYRIKSQSEAFERVVSEADLTLSSDSRSIFS